MNTLLEKAVEVAKEYARGGGGTPPQIVIKDVYEMLKKLDQGTAE